MNQPPEEFLQPDESEYKHDYASGIRAGYFWLKSNRLPIFEALREIPPPKGGFRLLKASTFRTTRLISKPVHTKVLRGWPRLLMWDSYFIVEPGADDATAESVAGDLLKLSTHEFQDCASEELLWSLISVLKPIYFFCDVRGTFCMISNDATVGTRLMNSKRFQLLEQKRLQDERNSRRNYWTGLAPECGPEKCVIPGCERLRIRVAVRCIRHQYEWGHHGFPKELPFYE